METTDRLWWLLGLMGLGSAAAAVVFPVWLLSTWLPLDPEFAPPITQILLFAGVFAAIFLVMALVLTIMSVRALSRARRRAAALRGHLDAMPLARLTADPAKAPDVSREPLVLSWRTTKSTRYIHGPFFIVYMLVGIANVGVALVALGLGFFSNLALDPLHLLLGAIALMVLALAVVLGVVVARYLPTLFGRPYGVSGDGEGITYRTEFGGRRFLPWSEMRLFEVSSHGSALLAVRRFRLYGSRVRVAWSDGPSSQTNVEPAGISAEEMALRLRALLDLIAARTGLLPRTFSRVLQAAEPGATQRKDAGELGALATAATFAVVIALCLGPAAAVLLLPLTTSALFNDVMAAPLVLVALLLAVAGVILAVQGLALPRAPIPPSISLPVAPPLDASHTTYILTVRVPLLRRLGIALAGLLLAIEIVPALLAIVMFPNLHVPGVDALPQVQGAGYPLAFVLALFGLMGVAFMYGAMRSATTVIHADAAGLSTRLTRSTSFLPWDGVEDIAARMHRSQVATYQAKGDTGRVAIGWSALRSQVVHATPSDGALPITPDEMAALVVKRSGKPLRFVSRL